MQEQLIRRLSAPVPRYTSYPTAPHFTEAIDETAYRQWLAALPRHTALSLYLHIPFCDRLCWFCGCNTKQVLRYEPVAAYLTALHAELRTLSVALQGRGRVAQIHLGGGSPSMLLPADMRQLAGTLRRLLAVADDVEFSIEVDPNDMTPDRYDAFLAAGITRVSIGVQDFDPLVQQAINRIQTVEQTRDVVEGVRRNGIRSVNIDVLYGLPHQTTTSIDGTLEAVLEMSPDRIALFGYAHVPWMKVHQKMIDEAALPDVVERYYQSQHATAKLIAAGYEPVGMDHFARPGDPLATAARGGHLHRNFQGYTTDDAPALIGLGASAIGTLPQGYAQNVVPTAEYVRRAGAGELPVARGVALSPDDRVRRHAIEQLMCNFELRVSDLHNRFGQLSDPIVEDIHMLYALDGEALVTFDGDRLALTERGRPFVRAIASTFDAYLAARGARHSVAI